MVFQISQYIWQSTQPFENDFTADEQAVVDSITRLKVPRGNMYMDLLVDTAEADVSLQQSPRTLLRTALIEATNSKFCEAIRTLEDVHYYCEA